MADMNQVDDIVAMLDNMVANGHGHINVRGRFRRSWW